MVCIDEEIPFEIPSTWEWCRISHLFLHTSGKQQSSNNKGNGTPQKFITTSNLYWGRFELDNVKVMNFTEEEIKNCSATKGDLLVCEGGAGYGRSAIWDKEYDICLQNHVHRLRPLIKGICEYVYYFIYLLKESNQLASVGTAMPGLSANRLKGLLLPLPPYQEQHHIVSKLKEVIPYVERFGETEDALSRLNSEIRVYLKKSIFQEAIQGKLVLQNALDEPASALLQRIKEEKQRLVKEGKLKKKDVVDSVIFKGDDNRYYEQTGKNVTDVTYEIPFDIPDSWEWKRLGNICELIGGYAFPSESIKGGNGIRVIRISDISECGFVNTRIVRYNGNETLSAYNIKLGDILMAMTGGTVGKSLFVTFLPEPMLLNQRVVIIRNTFMDRNYMNYVITAPHIKSVINEKKNSTNDNISMKDIYNFLIPVPPIEEQKQIANKIELAFNEIKDN